MCCYTDPVLTSGDWSVLHSYGQLFNGFRGIIDYATVAAQWVIYNKMWNLVLYWWKGSCLGGDHCSLHMLCHQMCPSPNPSVPPPVSLSGSLSSSFSSLTVRDVGLNHVGFVRMQCFLSLPCFTSWCDTQSAQWNVVWCLHWDWNVLYVQGNMEPLHMQTMYE